MFEGFGEEVGNVVICFDVCNFEFVGLDTLMKEVIFDVNVFDMGVQEGSAERLIAAVLSHRMVVSSSDNRSSDHSSIHNQIASHAASNAAVYSALQEEVATVFCFHAFQETTSFPSVQQ